MLRSIIEIHESDGSVVKLEDGGSSQLPEPCAITFPKIKEEIKWDPDELKQISCWYPGLGDDWSQRARLELGYSSCDDGDSKVNRDVIDLTHEEPVRDIKTTVKNMSDAKSCPTTAAVKEANSRHSNKRERPYAFAAENTSMTSKTVQETRSHRNSEHKSMKELKKKPDRKHSRSANKGRSVRKTTVPQNIANPEKEVCSCEYEAKTCAVHEDKKRHFCSLCGAMFLWKEYLDLHMASHAREMPYSCSVCSAKFRLQESLGKHMRFHSRSKDEFNSNSPSANPATLGAPFGCAICNLRFLWQDQLSSHLVIHPDKKLVFCAICGPQFSYENELFVHVAGHTRKQYTSTVRDGILVHPQKHSDSHTSSHSGEDMFSCSSCAQSFTSSKLLKCHSKLCSSQHHQLPCNSSPEVHPTIRPVVCDQEGLANRHEGGASASREEGLSKCRVPRKDFQIHTARSGFVFNDFFASSSKKNQDSDESVTKKRLCSPSVSRSEIPGSDMVNQHTKVQILEEKLCCLLCDAKFKLKLNLERHMFISHLSKRIYKNRNT